MVMCPEQSCEADIAVIQLAKWKCKLQTVVIEKQS